MPLVLIVAYFMFIFVPLFVGGILVVFFFQVLRPAWQRIQEWFRGRA